MRMGVRPLADPDAVILAHDAKVKAQAERAAAMLAFESLQPGTVVSVDWEEEGGIIVPALGVITGVPCQIYEGARWTVVYPENAQALHTMDTMTVVNVSDIEGDMRASLERLVTTRCSGLAGTDSRRRKRRLEN